MTKHERWNDRENENEMHPSTGSLPKWAGSGLSQELGNLSLLLECKGSGICVTFHCFSQAYYQGAVLETEQPRLELAHLNGVLVLQVVA